jgi:hypothetical protein
MMASRSIIGAAYQNPRAAHAEYLTEPEVERLI